MAGSSLVHRVLMTMIVCALSIGCTKRTSVPHVGTLRVSALATAAAEPANVVVYVGVTSDGEPVTDLDASSFHIYENGERLEQAAVRTTILPRDLVTSEEVVLLVDMSGKLSDQDREQYARAVEAFVRKLQTTLSVSVRGFAGEPKLLPIGDYPRAANPLEAPTPNAVKIAKPPPRDTSRDLHGAVVQGLELLKEKLAAQGKPVQLGTLVVFSRGPDLAGRLSDEEMQGAIEASPVGIVGIGLEEETPYLEFAKNGLFVADDPETVPNAVPITFEEAAAHVMKAYRKYYLVQYCSPAREGKRQARVEVMRKAEAGGEYRGELAFEFDAGAFDDGCDPSTTPEF